MPKDSVKLHSSAFVVISFGMIINHFICATSVTEDPVTKYSNKEINDLVESKDYTQIFQPVHAHQDVNTLLKSNINGSDVDMTFRKSLQFDVELLEDTQIGREDAEIEELYKGSSLIVNMDKVNDENIEMTFEQDKNDGLSATLIIFFVTLSIISTLVTVILCRKHIAQQLGTGELFVTSNNRDYWSDQLLPSHRVI